MKTFWGIIIILSVGWLLVYTNVVAEAHKYVDYADADEIRAISYIYLGYIPLAIVFAISSIKFSKYDWSNDLFYLLFKNLTKITKNLSNKSRNKLEETKEKLRNNLEDRND